MLADRNLTISHGGTAIEGKPDEGCVWWLFCLHFCCVMVNDVEDLQQEGFLDYGYAGDIAILVREFPLYSQVSYD
jgi:hypothetical protein